MGAGLSRPLEAATIPPFLDKARDHLQQLMVAAPLPHQDIDSTATRLRTLRIGAQRAKNLRSPGEES